MALYQYQKLHICLALESSRRGVFLYCNPERYLPYKNTGNSIGQGRTQYASWNMSKCLVQNPKHEVKSSAVDTLARSEH